jgi:hypothetical protein
MARFIRWTTAVGVVHTSGREHPQQGELIEAPAVTRSRPGPAPGSTAELVSQSFFRHVLIMCRTCSAESSLLTPEDLR